MKLEELAKVQITVGTKSLMRRLNADEVQEVFLADDADLYLKQKVTTLCNERNVPMNKVRSMQELGQACGVKVDTAAVGVLK